MATTRKRTTKAVAGMADSMGGIEESDDGTTETQSQRAARLKKEHDDESENFSTLQRVFALCALVFPIWTLKFIYETYFIVRDRLENSPGRYPAPSDFIVAAQFTALFCVLRVVLSKFVFQPFGYYFLDLKKYDEKSKADRISRFGTVGAKLCYFLFAGVWGFSVLKDKPWTPPIFGGSGASIECWTELPYHVVPEDVRLYYMISLAYHTHSLIFHVSGERRNDFMEMILHHTCTIFLMSFSYLINFIRIGTLVLFVHDVPDIFAYAIKFVVDTGNAPLILTFYFALLAVWGYVRLFVFPLFVIYSSFYESWTVLGDKVYGRLFFNAMLVMLFVLHVYWYTLFIKMGLKFANTGKAYDIQQKVKAEVVVDADAGDDGDSDGE